MQFFLLAAAAAIAAPEPAPAGPQASGQATNGADIVVRGTRIRDEQIRKFIRDLTTAPGRGQLARFEDKICPRAYGMPASYNALVSDRMRAVAAAAGMPIAKTDCQPNVVVMITKDKRSFIRRLAQQRPYMVPDEWSGWTLGHVAGDPSPAAAWFIEDKRLSDAAGYFPAKETAINWKA